LAKLIENLRQPNPKLGALFAVPSLPPRFLGRPELMRRVRDALLVDLQKPQVITSADAKVGMQGMGGIGKSVLAAALARNRNVRQSYPDGIIWISCGKNPPATTCWPACATWPRTSAATPPSTPSRKARAWGHDK